MKIEQVGGHRNFNAIVRSVVTEFVGDNGDIAALSVKADRESHRTVVATRLGVLDCSIDFGKPEVRDMMQTTPTVVRLVPWAEWPRVGVEGRVYRHERDEYEGEWRVTGLDFDLDDTARRSQEFKDFALACIEQQAALRS